MTLALFITIAVMILLTSIVVIYTFLRRDRITCMVGMMIAMTSGMIVGLTGGVILGIQFAGNLFIGTVLGMGIGLIIGFITGVSISIMAVLDGILAGIMGGMMGVMLGDMITVEYQDAMVKIMFVLFIAITLTLLYMVQNEVKSTSKYTPIFHNPFFLIIAFVVFFYIYNQLGPIIHMEKDNKEHNHTLREYRVSSTHEP